GSVFDRREIHWRFRRVLDFGRQHFLRETRFLSRRARDQKRRLHFRLSSARSATLRRGRVRQKWACDHSVRKAETTENPFRLSRSLRLRLTDCRSLQNAEAVRAWRARDY